MNSVRDFPFHFFFRHQKNNIKKQYLRTSNQNCWETLLRNQPKLFNLRVRGLFCSKHVKESGHVNTAERDSSEEWSGLLRVGHLTFPVKSVSQLWRCVWCGSLNKGRKIPKPTIPHNISVSIPHLSASLVARILSECKTRVPHVSFSLSQLIW